MVFLSVVQRVPPLSPLSSCTTCAPFNGDLLLFRFNEEGGCCWLFLTLYHTPRCPPFVVRHVLVYRVSCVLHHWKGRDPFPNLSPSLRSHLFIFFNVNISVYYRRN